MVIELIRSFVANWTSVAEFCEQFEHEYLIELDGPTLPKRERAILSVLFHTVGRYLPDLQDRVAGFHKTDAEVRAAAALALRELTAQDKR